VVPDIPLPMYDIFSYISYMQFVRQPYARADYHLTTSYKKEPDSVICELWGKEEYAPNNKEYGSQEIIEYMEPFVAFMDLAFMSSRFHRLAGTF